YPVCVNIELKAQDPVEIPAISVCFNADDAFDSVKILKTFSRGKSIIPNETILFSKVRELAKWGKEGDIRYTRNISDLSEISVSTQQVFGRFCEVQPCDQGKTTLKSCSNPSDTKITMSF